MKASRFESAYFLLTLADPQTQILKALPTVADKLLASQAVMLAGHLVQNHHAAQPGRQLQALQSGSACLADFRTQQYLYSKPMLPQAPTA